MEKGEHLACCCGISQEVTSQEWLLGVKRWPIRVKRCVSVSFFIQSTTFKSCAVTHGIGPGGLVVRKISCLACVSLI